MEILKQLFRKRAIPAAPLYTRTFSQYGEDQIIMALLYIFGIKKTSYIDIGANDPYVFSNTALLYERGIFGINIEPDPDTFKKLASARPNDVNLNIGISDREATMNYYRFTDTVYNTFSETEFKKLQQQPGLQILPSLQIAVSTYNQVVSNHLGGTPPTLLFIDTEGLDEIIIDSIDFENYAPQVLCVETFSYGQFKKDQELIKKIIDNGYIIHADTFVNTIFVHRSLLPYPQNVPA